MLNHFWTATLVNVTCKCLGDFLLTFPLWQHRKEGNRLMKLEATKNIPERLKKSVRHPIICVSMTCISCSLVIAVSYEKDSVTEVEVTAIFRSLRCDTILAREIIILPSGIRFFSFFQMLFRVLRVQGPSYRLWSFRDPNPCHGGQVPSPTCNLP